MNIVCLTGELGSRRELAVSLPAGWTSWVLDVRRDSDGDPGVVPVVLALRPSLVRAGEAGELRPGRPVLVIGKLEVEVDYRAHTPAAYHSVVVEQIELVPREGGGFPSLTRRAGFA